MEQGSPRNGPPNARRTSPSWKPRSRSCRSSKRRRWRRCGRAGSHSLRPRWGERVWERREAPSRRCVALLTSGLLPLSSFIFLAIKRTAHDLTRSSKSTTSSSSRCRRSARRGRRVCRRWSDSKRQTRWERPSFPPSSFPLFFPGSYRSFLVVFTPVPPGWVSISQTEAAVQERELSLHLATKVRLPPPLLLSVAAFSL